MIPRSTQRISVRLSRRVGQTVLKPA